MPKNPPMLPIHPRLLPDRMEAGIKKRLASGGTLNWI
jgi:hypothetical protein